MFRGLVFVIPAQAGIHLNIIARNVTAKQSLALAIGDDDGGKVTSGAIQHAAPALPRGPSKKTS